MFQSACHHNKILRKRFRSGYGLWTLSNLALQRFSVMCDRNDLSNPSRSSFTTVPFAHVLPPPYESFQPHEAHDRPLIVSLKGFTPGRGLKSGNFFARALISRSCCCRCMPPSVSLIHHLNSRNTTDHKHTTRLGQYGSVVTLHLTETADSGNPRPIEA